MIASGVVFSLSIATVVGVALNFTPINPIKVLLECRHQRRQRITSDGYSDADSSPFGKALKILAPATLFTDLARTRLASPDMK
jgi:hypothetical protein